MNSTDFDRISIAEATELAKEGACVEKRRINTECGGVFVGDKLVKTWGSADPIGHRNAQTLFLKLKEHRSGD